MSPVWHDDVTNIGHICLEYPYSLKPRTVVDCILPTLADSIPLLYVLVRKKRSASCEWLVYDEVTDPDSVGEKGGGGTKFKTALLCRALQITCKDPKAIIA